MKRIILSCFGLGRLPIAPGTWGSLPPAIIFALMCYFGAPAVSISIVMAALAIAGSVACVVFSPDVIKELGSTDPGEVVADELAGQAITFLVAAFFMPEGFTNWHIMVTAMAGFLLFRFFDILKPPPIYRIQKLPKGWGILADDILAGVYAAVVLQILLVMWIA